MLLAGCQTIQPPAVPTAVPATPLDAQPQPMALRGTAGGVYAPQRGIALTSDSRAFRPGDVLTVALEETTQASKKADTSFGKGSNVALSASSKGKTLLDLGVGGNRDFAGTSASTQQNALTGAITVVVVDVLPNGLLRVQGDKSLTLNQGEEMVRLSGYVRGADVDSENRVSSQRIANARIVYAGQGTLADANSPGWLTRFFASPWMPF
ncbi:flagellar basal body L-ring protein FlgH [Pelomonas sp. KK5]|uniref:flagellar basal body L-ring protein FlgH n=1 Tax=Pelomonas sp. KK5 TaxID=1855730 RepID=UPI00097BE6F0|nr:flagellar basal body L-ring protein FlgH [Pelomonas sp. KK5]